MNSEIKDFWNSRPCGAQFVGDLSDESRDAYEDFFRRHDDFLYAKVSHFLKNLDWMDFAEKF